MERCLTVRQEEILRHVLLSGGAVASAAVARGLSAPLASSTVRLEMRKMENLGFLSSLHHGSGKIATVDGYRYFASFLLEDSDLPQPTRQAIRERIGACFSPLEAIRQACFEVVGLTHQVGWGTPPRPKTLTLFDLTIHHLEKRRFLATWVTPGYLMRHTLFTLPAGLDAEHLVQEAKALSNKFRGRPLDEIRHHLHHDQMALRQALADVLDRLTLSPDPLLVAKASPAKDPEAAHLARELESNGTFQKLLSKLESASSEVHVFGEEETQGAIPPHWALVATPYTLPSGAGGWIGVAGRHSMPFPLVLPTLNWVASSLSHIHQPIS